MKILVVLAVLGACTALRPHTYDSYHGSSQYRNYNSLSSVGGYNRYNTIGSRYRNNYFRPSIRLHNGRFIGATTPAPAYNYGTTLSSAFRPISSYHVTTPTPLGQYAVTTSTPSYYQVPSYTSSTSYVTPTPANHYYSTPSSISTHHHGSTSLVTPTPANYYYSTPSSVSTYHHGSTSLVTPTPANYHYSTPSPINSYNYGSSSYLGNRYTITPAALTHHSVQSNYPYNAGTYNPYNALSSLSYNTGNSYAHTIPSNIVVANGFVQDTPEVAAAKAEFFRLYNIQAAAAAAAPDDYIHYK